MPLQQTFTYGSSVFQGWVFLHSGKGMNYFGMVYFKKFVLKGHILFYIKPGYVIFFLL